MKPVFIIAIVAVAMIGVMVPSSFAQSYEENIQKNLEKIQTRDSYVRDIWEAPMKDRWFVTLEICSGETSLVKPILTIISDVQTVEHTLNKSITEFTCTVLVDMQVKANDPDTIYFEVIDPADKNSEIEQLKNELEELKETVKEEHSTSAIQIVEESVVEESVVEESFVLPQESSEEGGGCLIATATYGSEMSQQVQQLRELRDNQLLQTKSGAAFMSTFNDIYYSFSPTIADYERENPYFKEAVKLAITPMISSLSLMENAETESEVLSIGISVIMLNLGMYLGVPAIVIVGIRKIK